MQTSLLLARIIGPYMLVTGLALFINRQNMKKMLKEFAQSNMQSFIIGAFTLIVGLLTLQFHNIWSTDWRLLITLTGWITTIKGAAAMIFPSVLTKIAASYKNNDQLLNIQALIAILFGLYLSYMGYFA